MEDYFVNVAAGLTVMAVPALLTLVWTYRRRLTSIAVLLGTVTLITGIGVGALSAAWLGDEQDDDHGDDPNPGNVFLSDQVEIYDFEDGGASGWEPLDWDTNWIRFKRSGDLVVTGPDVTLDTHSGPFVQYRLDLESEGAGAYLDRSAISHPLTRRLIGISAEVYYESDPQFSAEEVYAGFAVPYWANSKQLVNEDFVKRLVPNRWNTITWSLFGPVFWGDENKDAAWTALEEAFGDEAADLNLGRRLDGISLDWISIQFYVDAPDAPRRFQGTVYIDNIVLIYAP
jgi:hypothetical protein